MGLNRWRQIGRRLSQMERAELRDRVRQEFAKRQDLLLARIGSDFGRNSRGSVAIPPGNFFFATDSVESILTLLRQRCPGQAERIVQLAEKICKHRFDLLGYTDLDYAGPIDWHLDAVHGKRAPRKPFHRIRYLDYEEVGDSKVTWELNRHQHFVTLAKAYRLTGHRYFADEIMRQWRDWQADNPYPMGINWASSLEVAFRSLSWLWTYHLLNGAPGLPDFREEWLRGMALHGRHMERYLSTYFSPNTHLLGEGVGLLFLGVLCPELPSAERWKELGWRIVLQEAERQVRADGFHFEQSTYYHVYALDFFLHSALLASVNGMPIPKSFEDTLERMLTALYWLGREGSPARFGDDDGGRLFDPRRNLSEHLLDPLATGAILFHRGDYKAAAATLREETIWLLGSEGVRHWDELESKLSVSESVALSDAGFYSLRAEKATQLVMDMGPLGVQSGGHGHADALSICLQSQGRPLLIDPGTYEYVGPGTERDLFRGTAMHSTVRVDGVDQAEPATPFSWRRLTKTKVERWNRGKNFDLLIGSHDGYQRLQEPVTHRRSVLSLKSGIYLVRDIIEGAGRHRIDVAWHLAEELQLVAEGVFRIKGASQGLALLPVQRHGWAQGMERESWSPAYGRKAPMTTLNFSANVVLPAEFAVLLVTLEEANRVPGSFARIVDGKSDPAVRAYQYTTLDAEYTFIFGVRDTPWRMGSLASDAEFVCWKKKLASSDELLILCSGTFAQLDGGTDLRCSRPVESAESLLQDHTQSVFSSDMSAVVGPLTALQQLDQASPRPE